MNEFITSCTCRIWRSRSTAFSTSLFESHRAIVSSWSEIGRCFAELRTRDRLLIGWGGHRHQHERIRMSACQRANGHGSVAAHRMFMILWCRRIRAIAVSLATTHL